ncbi:hypothetical protein KOW79_015993 [Hemibagrus wyckioides]|uniref:Tetraspanin n=1 Tax=Hemibagrus wyckioides TaxID=337641 RepID=A0A9D3NDI8_9TELE|nr:23 kDa integral membrane protein-like [Hemibagrus wyckioides]KAG7320140.1 hypothetical protein KOW79_015993 [Hemibagrus wyckioides]
MAKGSAFMRRLCIVLNILLVFLGMGLLLVGIVISTFKTKPLIGGYYWQDGTYSVFFSIGFGLATILLSIIGIYGAYQEHVLVLFLYSIFMTLEFIALLTLTVISMLTEPQMERTAEESFKNMTTFYNTDKDFRDELNKLQQESECCGLIFHGDFKDKIPPSCDCPQNYMDKEARCTKIENKNDNSTLRYIYEATCNLILMKRVKNTLRIMYGTDFTLATIMLATVIVAFLMWQKINELSSRSGISHKRTKYELQPRKMT